MPFIDQVKGFKPTNDQEKNDKAIILEYIEKFQDTLLTRDNRIAHMTSSGLILNENLDKMLMIHHNIYDTWTWTGGHADGDRNMLEIAIKEAQEETGLKRIKSLSDDIASIDILPVWGHYKKGAYVSAHLHLNTSYILVADDTHTLNTNFEETSGVKWIDVKELEVYSNEPYLIDVYRKIIKRGKNIKEGLK